MKLEQQVCSLDLAERLKKLGVKQESYFCWWYTEAMSTDVKYFPDVDWKEREWKLKESATYRKSEEFKGRGVSAFTVAELGEMLPRYIIDRDMSCELRIVRSSVWRFYYGDICFTAGNDDTEADARAKMLIYLIKSNVVPVTSENLEAPQSS